MKILTFLPLWTMFFHMIKITKLLSILLLIKWNILISFYFFFQPKLYFQDIKFYLTNITSCFRVWTGRVILILRSAFMSLGFKVTLIFLMIKCSMTHDSSQRNLDLNTERICLLVRVLQVHISLIIVQMSLN